MWWLFHVVPLWRHHQRVEELDERARQVVSAEHGGPVRVWNHRIVVGSDGTTRARSTDEIDIDAGVLTPVVAAFARLFHRYRQHRWRRLAARLDAPCHRGRRRGPPETDATHSPRYQHPIAFRRRRILSCAEVLPRG